MKTSEKIVLGELLIIGGLGVIAMGKGCLMLCDRVMKLEQKQKQTDEILTILIKEIKKTKRVKNS